MPIFAEAAGGDWSSFDSAFVAFTILGAAGVAVFVVSMLLATARVVGSPLRGASPVDPPTDEDCR